MKKTALVFGMILAAGVTFAQPVLKSASSVNEYSLVYELYGGTNAASNKESYTENATVTLADPSRSGYTFKGWYWDEGLKNPVAANTFSNRKGALKVYAKWQKNMDFATYESEYMVEIIPGDMKVTLEDFVGTSGPQDIFGYSIGKYEVTQELYMAVTGTNPSRFNGEKRPVEMVTWYDAVNFCNELTKMVMGAENCCYTITSIRKNEYGAIESANVIWDQSKKGYRLPTEAEWEMAARGGVKGGWEYMYSGSDNIDDVAWYCENSPKDENWNSMTSNVGTKNANMAGLYDMSGNVWEWCWNQPSSGSSERVFRGGGYSNRVYRGGSYYDDHCAVSYNNSYNPHYRYDYLGFRVCRGL